MVFDWFFETKSGKKKGKKSFKKFLKEINRLEHIDKLIEIPLKDQTIDEKEERIKINKLFRKLEKLFEEFTNRINDQREELGLYISTSVDMYDYLSEVDKINKELVEEFNKVNVELYKDDFWTFIEKSSDIKDSITNLLVLLEEKMESFKIQSKKSLEWQYKAGTHNLEKSAFNNCVRDLGGDIELDMGVGGHFGVVFKLFSNTLAPARHQTNQIAGGTFKSWSTDKGKEKGRVKRLIEQHMNHKYFVCFFMNYSNKTFRDVFIKKYRILFNT